MAVNYFNKIGKLVKIGCTTDFERRNMAHKTSTGQCCSIITNKGDVVSEHILHACAKHIAKYRTCLGTREVFFSVPKVSDSKEMMKILRKESLRKTMDRIVNQYPEILVSFNRGTKTGALCYSRLYNYQSIAGNGRLDSDPVTIQDLISLGRILRDLGHTGVFVEMNEKGKFVTYKSDIIEYLGLTKATVRDIKDYLFAENLQMEGADRKDFTEILKKYTL